MTEEQKKEYRQKRERIKQSKANEFKKLEEFQRAMREEKLGTFKDRPDAVTNIRCVHVEGRMFVVEWDAPDHNNSPIMRYNVYLSNKKVMINEISD
jgi:hypothetical protein